jgi:hypothetical protein
MDKEISKKERDKMKGIGKKAVKFSLALALVLSIGLIPAMPTAQASVGNWVNVDFFNAYIYSTELDSVVYDASLPADTIVTGTGMNNPEEETPTGESVVGEASLNGGPLLTFTPGAVTVEGWETQDWRDGTEYIWDLYPIPENEGKGRSVAVAPEGASFQPGFTVNRSFSNPDDETDPDPTEFPDPGTYHQMLNINTTPKVPTNELVIIVNIPGNPLLTATITDATGDGITADNWSASGAQISIPGPTTGTIYSQTFTIEVEVYEGGVSFKPEMQVIAWHNVVAIGQSSELPRKRGSPG